MNVIKDNLKKFLKKYAPYFFNKLQIIFRRPYDRVYYAKPYMSKYLNIYCIGKIEVFNESTFQKIKDVIADADICIGFLTRGAEYHFNKCSFPSKITVICTEDSDVSMYANIDNVIYVPQNAHTVFQYNNIKVGILNANIQIGYKEIKNKIKALKVAGVEYFIAYIRYNEKTPENANIMKMLSTKVNQTIGVSDGHIYSFNSSQKIIDSIGFFTKKTYKSDEERTAIILQTRIKKYKEKIVRLDKSYMGCFYNDNARSIDRIFIHEPKQLIYRRILGEKINNIYETERSLNVKKIFDILKMNVPYKYRNFLEIPIAKLCVYPFELSRKSVLFLRDYDNVVHGGTAKQYYKDKIEKIRLHSSKGLVFVFSPVELPKDIPHIVVNDPLKLHRTLCNYIINLYDFEIKVAITGSTGKTSAKEMVALVLSKKFNTFKNTGNENLQTKMGLLIQEINPSYEAYVQEVGGGKINGASNVSKMIEPDVGVVTNVGYAHLRWSKTREQLAINKIGIGDGLRNNGPLFINIDNDMLQKADVSGRNIVTYAIDNCKADYKAENIIEKNNCVEFDVRHNDHLEHFILNIPGRYNVYNALISFGIGEYAGINVKLIREAIAEFTTQGIRQTLIHIGGYNLFIDCFNASPDSMCGAVETLSKMDAPNTKKIAILADMTGLEDLTEQLHREVGMKISQYNIDFLICYGKDIKILYDNYSNDQTKKFYSSDKNEIISKLKELMTPGDYILFKGSSRYKMEAYIIDEVFGTNLMSIAYERRKPRLIKKFDISYRIYPEEVYAISGKSEKRVIRILDKVKGKKVTSVAERAFADVQFGMIKLPRYIRNIQKGAFDNCTNLHHLSLPDNLNIIETEAFLNCIKLKEVKGGMRLTHVGDRAFCGCKGLRSIFLNKTVRFIGQDAFASCDNLTIICLKDSYAEKYALDNLIPVHYIEDEEK